MEININCLRYLSNHSFIRNENVEDFVIENNQEIIVSRFLIYCVGIINSERYVHVIKIIGQTSTPGVTSYLIEWFNTACRPLNEFHSSLIESVQFWVHSGVALRKNFFLFEDRMSLLKSSFIFDNKRKQYYRMSNLLPYLQANYIDNTNYPIYSSPTKISFASKKSKKVKSASIDQKNLVLKKNLKKVIKSCNSFGYIENHHPRLFEEISKIIN